MNIMDQIIASGYYVFDGNLSHHVVRTFISLAREAGKKFKQSDLKMKELSKYMEFDANSCTYKLKDDFEFSNIANYIDFSMVAIFHNIKKARDKYYSGMIKREEPTFESAMEKFQRKILKR